jgi:hypothetical protein
VYGQVKLGTRIKGTDIGWAIMEEDEEHEMKEKYTKLEEGCISLDVF